MAKFSSSSQVHTSKYFFPFSFSSISFLHQRKNTFLTIIYSPEFLILTPPPLMHKLSTPHFYINNFTSLLCLLTDLSLFNCQTFAKSNLRSPLIFSHHPFITWNGFSSQHWTENHSLKDHRCDFLPPYLLSPSGTPGTIKTFVTLSSLGFWGISPPSTYPCLWLLSGRPSHWVIFFLPSFCHQSCSFHKHCLSCASHAFPARLQILSASENNALNSLPNYNFKTICWTPI